jgi:retinol dehydrogenase 14
MTNPSSRPMTGKAVLITGGSGGIGRATALRLAQMGASVSILGRDAVRTTIAAREITSASSAPVNAFTADLSSQAEVRRVAVEVLARLTRLDVLVNNVGGYWHTRHTTVDGLERTFAVNHLAPSCLIKPMETSAPARTESSRAG